MDKKTTVEKLKEIYSQIVKELPTSELAKSIQANSNIKGSNVKKELGKMSKNGDQNLELISNFIHQINTLITKDSGDRLKEERNKLNLSREQLAQRINIDGINENIIRDIEHGTKSLLDYDIRDKLREIGIVYDYVLTGYR